MCLVCLVIRELHMMDTTTWHKMRGRLINPLGEAFVKLVRDRLYFGSVGALVFGMLLIVSAVIIF